MKPAVAVDPMLSADDSYGSQTWTYVDEIPASRSPSLPVLIGVVALVIGAALAAVSWGQAETNFPLLAIIGYVLTPLATALLLAWTLARHRVASASDTYDMTAGRRLVKLGIAIALLGFVIGALLTFQIGVWVAQLAVFNGAPS